MKGGRGWEREGARERGGGRRKGGRGEKGKEGKFIVCVNVYWLYFLEIQFEVYIYYSEC